MGVLIGSTGVLLLVNGLCAIVALGVGFAAGVWFFGAAKPNTAAAADKSRAADQEADSRRASERAVMASQRLKDLAQSMVSDVGAHASHVEAITADLRSLQPDNTAGVDTAVFAAIAEIVDANSQLQKRLEVAEHQIQVQAAEIRVQASEARTDSLTGLANRRAFDDEIRRRLAEWDRRKTPVTLLLFDIDHFKKFNDTYGHQAGDEVLRHVGKLLSKAAREMDIPCRYGGEEFAVILPATTVEQAHAVAERVRINIETATVQYNGQQLRVTVSIGTAQPGSPEDASQLIKRADEALYRSKEAGRNCGHWHDGRRCLPITSGMQSNKRADADGGNSTGTAARDRLSTGAQLTDQLQRRLSESCRFGVPLSVMHVTIEGYSSLKQQFGAAVADLALDAAAEFIQSTLRDMDLLAWLEEDQFIVMLPGSTKHEATLVAERMKHKLPQSVASLNDRPIRLEVRYGLADAQADDTPESVIQRAKKSANTSGDGLKAERADLVASGQCASG